MQSRDVYDPQTIRDVAHQVETVERLKALTLLTYADISAVNPTVMTDWRSEQFWQLYLIVHAELTRELEDERVTRGPARIPAGFPTRYLRTHLPEEIAGHIELGLESRKKNGVAAQLKKLSNVVAAHAGRPRPPRPVRRRRRSALELRHEHPPRRGIRQPSRRDPRHLHLRGPAPHAGAESARSRPPLRDHRARPLRQNRRPRPAAQPPRAATAQPESPHPRPRHLRRRPPARPPPSSRSSPRTAPACSTTSPPPSPPPARTSKWSSSTPKPTKRSTCST